MNKNEFKSMLENMYNDVNFNTDNANVLLSLANDFNGDKSNLLRNIYFKENSPVKVMNTTFNVGSNKDYQDEMLTISMKYDEFIIHLNQKAADVINKRSKAVDLFIAILSLPEPYSQLLYLRYYKRLSSEEIMDKLFISRSTYYRNFDKGLNKLIEIYNKR